MFASGLSGASADLDGSGEGVSRPARGEGVKTGCRVVAPGATLTGMAHQPLHLPATDRPLRDPSRPAQDGTFALSDARDGPPEGERWSAWDHATHGPEPRPDWVVTDLGAVESDLGVLKTGKEADVHLVRRWVPGTDHECLLAAKRYRSSEHRLFHRDAGYLEGRRVRKSREMRAMQRRTDFGRQMIAGQWAIAEFNALAELWSRGLPVPYPVQLDETEMLMEDARRPLALQRPRPRRRARHHRLAPGHRHPRQPAGLRAPRAGRAHDVRVVRAAWSRSRRRDALRRLRRPRCRPLTPFGRRPGASPLRRAPLQIRRGT